MNGLGRTLLGCLLAWAGLVAGQAGEGFTPVVIGVRSWSVAGPYPSTAVADLDRPFPPESKRDFAREMPGTDADAWLNWREAAAGNDLRLWSGPPTEAAAIAYAVTYIEASANGSVRLAITSAVPYRLWLDGAPYVPGAAADLAAGIHELLVKQRLSQPADTLRITCEGPAGLRFLPQPPWPMRAMPATMWRMARPADPAALRQQLAQAGGLGLPELADCVWTAPTADGEAVRCAGSPDLFLVGHVFIPLKYHLQEYRIRLRGLRPAAVLLNGKAMGLAVEAADAVSFKVAAHTLQQGFNRIAVEIPPAAGGGITVEISDPGDLKFAAEVPAQLDPTRPAGTWPSAVISNGLVTACIALPDDERGLYRGNRFERAGIISRLEYAGHTYFVGAPEKPQPLNHWVCYGPAEEWFDALAWHDARLGEPFLKMGVGLYERPAHPLHMWYCVYWPQAILPWTSRVGGGTAEFTQTLDGPRGWGYRYTKRLVLEPGRPVLRIEHELVNTGTQRIVGEQYNHNFIRLDDRPLQAGYRCDLAFAPKPVKDIAKFAHVEGNAVIVNGPPPGPFGSDLAGWSDPVADQTFTVSCPGTPAKVRISGSAPLAKLFMYFDTGYLAVEPFVRIAVEPGATTTWTRTYAFIAE